MAEIAPDEYLVARGREQDLDTVRIFTLPESNGLFIPKEVLIARAQNLTDSIWGVLTEQEPSGLSLPIRSLETHSLRGVATILDRLLRTQAPSIEVSADEGTLDLKRILVELHEKMVPGSARGVAQKLGVAIEDFDKRPVPGQYL